MGTYYTSVSTTTDVDVEIDFAELADDLSENERRELAELLATKMAGESGARAALLSVENGDASRFNMLIERAYLAARQIDNLPREVADLFWHVHGRAI